MAALMPRSSNILDKDELATQQHTSRSAIHNSYVFYQQETTKNGQTSVFGVGVVFGKPGGLSVSKSVPFVQFWQLLCYKIA
jgi:hypothetical protein